MPQEQIKISDLMRKDAATIFDSALSAVNAFNAVKNHCRREKNTLYINQLSFNLDNFKNIYVIGAGKASAHMGAAVEEILAGKITDGIINVKYGHTVPLKKIRLKEAGHPIPDENGRKCTTQILNLAERSTSEDLIICLISGGGSALLPLPASPLTLADTQDTIQELMVCGASIHDINTLRKHTSRIKGGQLAEKSWPATLISLMISDVVGNSLETIASGPTVADSGTFSDCMQIIEKYDLENKLPPVVIQHIQNGIRGNVPETPKPDAPIFDRTYNVIVADNMEALSAARATAESLGYHTIVLSSLIEGDTGQVAHMHAAIAKEIRNTGNPIRRPACILSGGETTVILKGNGKGGRNQEFALTAAIDIANEDGIVMLSGGTDGTDGPTDAAGAIVDSQTVTKAKNAALDPAKFLENNDSYQFFHKTGDLLITGPTGTNVMDLRVILVR